jgi:4-hydroxy-tetrahydrodipicolinate synthase
MTMKSADLKGVFPALVTPFKSDGRVDADALTSLIDRMFSGGASGVIPLGGTGEYTALSPVERVAVVKTAVAAAKGRGPVIAGLLSPGFAEAAEAGAAFAAAGADALMVVTPFYVIGGQQGLIEYHRKLRDAVGLPLVLYEIPSRTNVSFTPETVALLGKEGVAIGIKYSNHDVVKFTRVVRSAGSSLSVMGGEDNLIVAHMVLGARGAVLATANLCPELWVECFNLAVSGDVASAAALQKDLYPMIDAVFAEPNPGPLKKAMEIMGHPVGSVRLPLVPVSADTEANLKTVLRTLPSGAIAERRVQSA